MAYPNESTQGDAIEAAILENPTLNNSQIARLVGSSHPTVGKVRKNKNLPNPVSVCKSCGSLLKSGEVAYAGERIEPRWNPSMALAELRDDLKKAEAALLIVCAENRKLRAENKQLRAQLGEAA